VKHLTIEELEVGLAHIREAPKQQGTLEYIVRRPRSEEREVLPEAELDLAEGLVGDNWKARGSKSMADGSANPEMQINIMNARAIALVAHTKERWQLAGDQLFIDMDISLANMPPGTRLEIGSALLEVTALPHNGCHKFAARFGAAATKFVNSVTGKSLHLRGINAKVVKAGQIRVGALVRKL
jgi:MOSC domain-containing protein YiiM